MPALRLWLVRHGQSTANAGAPAVDDAPLTALGRAQASGIARRIDTQPALLVVSPLRRAIETAQPIRERWPDARCETWPIGEFTYLSPARCIGTVVQTRRPWIVDYWARCDPDHVDGADAESFAHFMARIEAFDRRVRALDGGLVVVVGHGQFLRGYALGLQHGFGATAAHMRAFRDGETREPLGNGELFDATAAFNARTAG